MQDVWRNMDPYERYIGRWSRPVAREFVAQLSVPSEAVWIDVGCGSGALTEAIVTIARPKRVIALDRSYDFAAQFRRRLAIEPVTVMTADAVKLPLRDNPADAVVSGLVLNFVPDPVVAVTEMLRCARPGGVVATYLWDYAEGMQLIRAFWDAAIALDRGAVALDEAVRFPLCTPERLRQLFVSAGADDVRVGSITIPTVFRDFEDLWSPFLGGQGPAPTYAMALAEEHRTALRERLRQAVASKPKEPITLSARAWVVRGLSQK
jgi:SAM-dependent methyltransferase